VLTSSSPKSQDWGANITPSTSKFFQLPYEVRKNIWELVILNHTKYVNGYWTARIDNIEPVRRGNRFARNKYTDFLLSDRKLRPGNNESFHPLTFN
jgi:hypothetical protein